MMREWTLKIAAGMTLAVVLLGLAGCGSKTPSESEKTQSVAPNDSMQKAYSGSRPGASAQPPK